MNYNNNDLIGNNNINNIYAVKIKGTATAH